MFPEHKFFLSFCNVPKFLISLTLYLKKNHMLEFIPLIFFYKTCYLIHNYMLDTSNFIYWEKALFLP